LEEVGVDRGAWRIVGCSFGLLELVPHTTLPQLNAASTVQARQRIITVASGLMLVYALGMWLAAQYVFGALLPLLYGESFHASAQLVPALALIPVLKAFSFLGVLLLIQQQHLRIRIGVQISVVALLWVIAPLLIPTYGITGAITVQFWCESVLAVGYLLTGVLGMHLSSPPSTNPHHLYISNMHGVGNIGDLAIHQAQLAMLQQRYPQATFTLAYADCTNAQLRFAPHSVVHGLSHWVYTTDGQIAPLHTRLRRMVALALALPVLRWGGNAHIGLHATEAATLQALARADLVCASGGGYLYDAPHHASLWRFLTWDWYLIADMLVAIWLGRPLVLLPQSFGPIHSRWLRWGVQYVTRHAQHVYARESWSSTWLTKHGIAHTMAADLAWRWAKPHPPSHNTPPVLGITAIDWGAQYAGFAGQQAYEERLCTVMRHYVAHGWQIRLFVQCHDTNPAWDDTQVTQRLWAQMAHPAVQIIPFIDEPQALQHAYAQLDRMLTTRFHAAILRLACQLPCVVLSYLPKATATMHDLGLGAWCLDIADSDAPSLIAALESSAAQYALVAHLPITATAFECAPSGYPSADPQ
ncbi:MAG: polysaccharide pyruvyl transferase family protein, partial [Roseiflexaceae bacterium]